MIIKLPKKESLKDCNN